MEPVPTMPLKVSIVERAFQLADCGCFHRVRDIALHLRKEGYMDVGEHILESPTLRRQLRSTIRRRR